MTITVHRGTHQIGGCATEIRTKDNRILIDAGSELDGNAPLHINGITKGYTDCDAVLFTHYHGDHIGLLSSVNDDIPLYIGELSKEILVLQNNRQNIFPFDKISALKTYKAGQPLSFGDIKITPFMVDHSAFDSHFFLIEAEGKKILHTGDFRTHGFRGKGLLPTLKKYVEKIDALICEGTTMDRNSAKSMTEFELSLKAKDLLQKHKYVFVICASTNIDRIAAFCSAVPRGKYCLCDKYQKDLLDLVKNYSSKYSSLYEFEKMLTYSPNLNEKIEKQGFCMFVRLGSKKFNDILEKFKNKEPLLIYSMWSGYLDNNEEMQKQLAGYNLVRLHTSGHADVPSISSVIKATNPDKVIPIHTSSPDLFSDISGEVMRVNDGDKIEI